MTRLLGVAAACWMAGAASALADTTFTWTFNDGAGVTGSGTITASNTSGSNFVPGDDGGLPFTHPWNVTGLTGTIGGDAVSLLLPLRTCCSSPANNNVLYTDFFDPFFFDLAGLGVEIVGDPFGIGGGTATTELNVFDPSGAARLLWTGDGCGPGGFGSSPCFGLVSGNGTFNVNVPGPIAGAGLPGLLFAGGGLLGWWRSRRQRKAA
jgi:hypothetical protein